MPPRSTSKQRAALEQRLEALRSRMHVDSPFSATWPIWSAETLWWVLFCHLRQQIARDPISVARCLEVLEAAAVLERKLRRRRRLLLLDGPEAEELRRRVHEEIRQALRTRLHAFATLDLHRGKPKVGSNLRDWSEVRGEVRLIAEAFQRRPTTSRSAAESLAAELWKSILQRRTALTKHDLLQMEFHQRRSALRKALALVSHAHRMGPRSVERQLRRLGMWPP
jgi:hypothetical protein